MSKTEILARLAELDHSTGPLGYDLESEHMLHDTIVAELLAYIADGGADPAEVAAALREHESPTEWGWYA